MLVKIKNLISPQKKLVVANVMWLLFASTINQGFTAVSLLITARSLGPFFFGQLSACLALTRLSSIFFNLGTDTWMLRVGQADETSIGVTIANVLIIKSTFGLIWFICLSLLSQFLDPNTYPLLLLLTSAATIWVEAVVSTLSQGFNILLKNDLTLGLTVISSSFLLVGTLLVSALPQNTPLYFVFVRLITGWITAGIGLLRLARISYLHLDHTYISTIIIQSLPFALSDTLLIIYTQADTALIAILLGSQSAGFYSTASGILRATFVIPSAVFLVMTPIISQLGKQGNLSRFSSVIVQTFLSLLGIGFTLWLLVRIGGPLFITLILREKFAPAGTILTILSIILLFKSCSYALASVIIATEKQTWRVVVQGIAALANLCLNVIIIPFYGIIGAAWVYVASEGLLLLGYIFVATKGYLTLLKGKQP